MSVTAEYFTAMTSLVGLTLDSLGGVFLAYDLLGGEHGPLRVLGRVVVYGVIFVLGYVLVLGPLAGAIAGVGLALLLGIEFSRAARNVTPTNRSDIVFASLRGVILGAACSCIGGIVYGIILSIFAALSLVAVYLLKGASPGKSYDLDLRRNISVRKLAPSIFRGVAVSTAAAMTALLVGEPFSHGVIPFWLRLGCSVALVSSCITLCSGSVERLFTTVQDKEMGKIGAILLLLGFGFQSIQFLVLFAHGLHGRS